MRSLRAEKRWGLETGSPGSDFWLHEQAELGELHLSTGWAVSHLGNEGMMVRQAWPSRCLECR